MEKLGWHLECTCNQHDDLFSANGEVITFDGFLKVYIEGTC